MRSIICAILILVGMGSIASACPSWNYTGQTYTFSGQQLSQPRNFSVVAGGQNALLSCGFQNAGYVTTPPDFSFGLNGLAASGVTFSVVSGCDAVLLVNTATTTWFFDDDSNGNLDPRLTISGGQHLNGRVDVWVGSYNGQYCNATLTLQAQGGAAPGYAPAAPNQSGQSAGAGNSGYTSSANNCPTFALIGTTYNFTGAQLYRQQAFDVTAGGGANITRCPNVQPVNDRGPGYFATAPQYSFNLSGMGQYRLVLAVVSQCDATMLINTGTGQWFYDDDDNGNLDPRIDLSNPPDGRLDVWVGTYGGGTCGGRLTVETFYR